MLHHNIMSTSQLGCISADNQAVPDTARARLDEGTTVPSTAQSSEHKPGHGTRARPA